MAPVTHRWSRARLPIAAAGLAVSLAVATGLPVSAQGEMRTIRLGLSPYQDYMSTMIGVEKGWFEEAGLDLQIYFQEWGEQTESLAGGSLDMINQCDTDILTRAVAFPEQVFANIVYYFAGSGVLVRPDSGLTTFQENLDALGDKEAAIEATGAQLKGRTAIAAHNTDHELTIAILAQKGGLAPFEDLEWIDMPPAEGLAAFLGGTGDLYNGGIPQRLRGLAEGMALLVTVQDLLPEGAIFCGFATTEDWYEQNIDAIVDFQSVWYRIQRFVKNNPTEAYRIISDNLKAQTGEGVTPEQLALVWNQLEFFPTSGIDMAETVFDPASDWYWRTRFEYVLDFYRNAGVIEGDVDIDRIARFLPTHEAYMAKYEPNIQGQ